MLFPEESASPRCAQRETEYFTFISFFWFQVSRSNATAAYLKNVGFRVAGNVSCEVTMDTKGFKTKHAGGFLQVVSPPLGPPAIRANQDKYKAGDTLAANCTSLPSRPASKLSFYITRNNNQVKKSREKTRGDNLGGVYTAFKSPTIMIWCSEAPD